MLRKALPDSSATGAPRTGADVLALIYIGLIATIAGATGAFYVMFPELAALSWNVMEQPRGRWASSPLMLAMTPPLTGLMGTVMTRSLPYGFASVLITVVACIAIVTVLRSPVAPAISAGLLPLVLGVTSWWYPPGILLGSTLLAAISIPWRRYTTAPCPLAGPETVEAAAAPNAFPGSTIHPGAPAIVALLTFVVIAVTAVKLTGMRFILFPPLVVILYEMLCHPADCHWIGRPVVLPLACFVAAFGGYLFRAHIAVAPLAAMLSMAWGVAVLRALKIRVPPALAVALLPMVMTHLTVGFPFAVGIGTALASGWFLLFEKWRNSRGHPAPVSSPPISPHGTAV
jgi:hypothetical protein